ncbi:hypothetical protein PYS58_00150 [Chryseobacterium indologenes]|uniref:hypothetical protein n=1 Tax=Chryseobacterium TaxID=59732 RepID=UPI00162A50D2|nr:MULTISPECIES: hypothetical protein [Chryseobacterium]MDM1553434.1 hypothetical protein [Chryseobacterium indologenes]WET49552.1 hypothetical protein PYS58_00150 [Chryseobacterium indologenes]
MSENKTNVSDDFGLTPEELAEYDKHVDFYYTNIINSLILYTYNAEELDRMAPILINPLTELYEELDYAFLPMLFETVFRNKLIDESFKGDLLQFKKKIDDTPNEIWNWNVLDSDETWKNIRLTAKELLGKMNIATRVYNVKYTTIIPKRNKMEGELFPDQIIYKYLQKIFGLWRK